MVYGVLEKWLEKSLTTSLCSSDPYTIGSHPLLAVTNRKKILNIATMPLGFSNPISTPPCMFENILLGKFWKNG